MRVLLFQIWRKDPELTETRMDFSLIQAYIIKFNMSFISWKEHNMCRCCEFYLDYCELQLKMTMNFITAFSLLTSLNWVVREFISKVQFMTLGQQISLTRILWSFTLEMLSTFLGGKSYILLVSIIMEKYTT